ncbi:MAG: tRNA pseudouridine(38-40) synthase TruA [Treponema sp.]
MCNESARKICLRVSYDGTHFHGWQKQLHHGKEAFRTVQGEIERALALMHKHPVELFGSGRTDAGVHAYGQVAHFCTDIAGIAVKNFVPALNALLPKDIRIIEAQQVSPLFHARFSSIVRTYRYFLRCGAVVFAHQVPYCWHIPYMPDISRLNAMAKCLRGELDCTTFAAAGDKSHSKFRYLYTAHFFLHDEYVVFEIAANAFLWKMVRSITGTLLQYEHKKRSVQDFETALSAKDRRYAGPTAPSQGLFLWSITYPPSLFITEPLAL